MQVENGTAKTVVERTPKGREQLIRLWEAPSAARAAVIVVHGIAEHSGRYEHVGRTLAAAGLSTRAFDLWGFGESSGARSFVERWDDYVDQVGLQVAAFADADLPTFLMGHSMGGLIALTYAIKARRPLAGLILSAPALHADIAAWKKVMARLLSRVAPKVQIPNELDGDMLSKDPEVVARYFNDPLVRHSTSARLGAELLSAMQRAREGLGRLSVPTLVLHGGRDRLVPTRCSEPFAKIACVDRKVYDDLRHEIFNEPEHGLVLGDVVEWIAGHLGNASRVSA